MEGVDIIPPDPMRSTETPNPLPQLLQTPAGFAILEIQGTIHAPRSASSSNSAEASQIGKIVLSGLSAHTPPEDQSWMKRIYLYVGKHQRLTGEVKKLSKPLAILRKSQSQALEANGSEVVEVAEIVRYKIIFSQRPEPVGQDSAS